MRIFDLVFSILFCVGGVLSTIVLIGMVHTVNTAPDTITDMFIYEFIGTVFMIGVSYILCGIAGHRAFTVKEKT